MGHENRLIEVADGVHAYLQLDGSWGYSNAGLVVGDGASTLIDTLFDLQLTAAMLDAMAPLLTSGPVQTVVNTHGNGDHCYGNQLVAAPGVDIVASAATKREIEAVPPSLLVALQSLQEPASLRDFVAAAFGPFRFDDIDVATPTTTFDGTLRIDVGDRSAELIEVGPAHTDGDVIAWLPHERVVFTGDIAFIGSTPIMWAGPLANWITACDRIVALDPAVVVPGHGPLTDPAGVAVVGDYLRTVRDGVIAGHAAGLSPDDVASQLDAEIDDSPFAGWSDRERLVVTVHNEWRQVEPGYQPPDVITLFVKMATYFERSRR